MSATQIKERPIIFSGPMVKAILERRKTQTRRVVKFPKSQFSYPPPHAGTLADGTWMWSDVPVEHWLNAYPDDYLRSGGIRCPYGQPGDRLWVRETWCHKRDDNGYIVYNEHGDYDTSCLWYRASNPEVCHMDDDGSFTERSPWVSPIHMPRWASRLTLEITDVRVQRVSEISEKDALAEGAIELVEGSIPGFLGWWHNGSENIYTGTEARQQFVARWDDLNAKRGYPWADNPWVWCITFKRVEQPEN